ncbi:MAG: NFACT family protein, partial [Spirochaetaceae bacterium]|nr:NFACT family protein [Spirochaetaceae bacterium]
MSLNWKEIDLILEELDLEGSFIQQIVQPSYETIALHTYKSGTSKTVLVCLAGGACRIHQTWTAVPKNTKPLRFMEFLKARIKGARINAIRQLGQERIIKLELSHCGQEFLLYIRLWSNAANIILTDTNGCILDSFYRRPGKGEVTGGTFSEPEETPAPPQSPDKEQKQWTIRDFQELPDSQELSFNQKVDRWYREHGGQLSLESLLEQAQKFYTSRHSKMEAALHRLEKKRDGFLQNQQ